MITAIKIRIIPPISLEYVPIFFPIIFPNINPEYVKIRLDSENTIDDNR